ncbi:hypothetical protein GCM10017653_46970 [Ancylobacter defluvii]|uniref:Uncharacterized protein n=1 Tax=Ancylobacter defluvii TaxID=1282440 RepID=A0A9W6K0N6_9HYPH|nr:hypothetical protein GCM10017653_46970 [Ancylobacter defluvii]
MTDGKKAPDLHPLAAQLFRALATSAAKRQVCGIALKENLDNDQRNLRPVLKRPAKRPLDHGSD